MKRAKGTEKSSRRLTEDILFVIIKEYSIVEPFEY